MNKGRVWFLAIVAALGGFLFGFDTIVINGAEQDIQRVWGLSVMMVLHLFWAFFLVPETKGKELK